MILKDLHTHTTYCDGKNTPAEMVEAAVKMGLAEIGFSGHCFTAFDTRYCMSVDNVTKYITEISALKPKYKGKIKISCGVEQDYYATFGTFGFDYVIGSVHYIKMGEDYIPIDESAEILRDATDKYFGGDIYALCEEYFKTVGDLLNRIDADIIGHFDLISKFNEGNALFDESHPRYVAAYTAALDKLLEHGKPFEVNTGAISRGYRTHPYPSHAQLEYIAKNNGCVMLTGDTHAKENLCYEFEKWHKVCEAIGIMVVN